MRYIAILILALSSHFAFTQGIESKVVDEGNNVLVGTFIENINSGSHAHTSDLGVFYLENTVIGDSLRISNIGYKTLIVRILKEKNVFILKPSVLQLSELNIAQELNALSSLQRIDVSFSPINSSQDLLTVIPGLFIGQHAGGGKAEQIFLRGFDVDHGTDVAVSVDGMPVNMVSHAHGQGYADLHFLIPELVSSVSFEKGSYDADYGNFATAGAIDFKTKDKLSNSQMSLEHGMYNNTRLLLIQDLLAKQDRQNAFIAIEHRYFDGPFQSSQNFGRTNIYGKYVKYMNNQSKLSLSSSYFTSTWTASGQIPERAVRTGQIDRFGAIDDTEGGSTSRANTTLEYVKTLNSTTSIKSLAYFSMYNFQLYSNFTFYLEDSINGDQIMQKESRNLYGFRTEVNKYLSFGKANVSLSMSVGMRKDQTNNSELSKTLNRSIIRERVQLGDVSETNYFSTLTSETKFRNWRLNLGLRADYFHFQYVNHLSEVFDINSTSRAVYSPKLKLSYIKNNIQYYYKSGYGFHTNDTRVILNGLTQSILPKTFGNDLGVLFKLGQNTLIDVAAWNLYMDQEFVYVGDAGIIELGGKTLRKGIDFGIRYQWGAYFYIQADATYTKAQFVDQKESNSFIPLAPKETATLSLGLKDYKTVSLIIKSRYLGDRPANEENSIIAKGYFVVDASIQKKIKQLKLGIAVQNALNTTWNETQFATESRLLSETQSTEEIHFTPGIPFYLTGKITFLF